MSASTVNTTNIKDGVLNLHNKIQKKLIDGEEIKYIEGFDEKYFITSEKRFFKVKYSDGGVEAVEELDKKKRSDTGHIVVYLTINGSTYRRHVDKLYREYFMVEGPMPSDLKWYIRQNYDVENNEEIKEFYNNTVMDLESGFY